MKNIISRLALVFVISSTTFAEDILICSTQVGGGSKNRIILSKVCLSSHNLFLSFNDYSQCPKGSYPKTDECIKELNESFIIEGSKDAVDKWGRDVQEITVLNVKTGQRSFVLALGPYGERCPIEELWGPALGQMSANYLCKSPFPN